MNRDYKLRGQRTGCLPKILPYSLATYVTSLPPVNKSYQGIDYVVFGAIIKDVNGVVLSYEDRWVVI